VNEHGVVVAVTNRLKSSLPAEPRSRGTLCRELLDCRSAAEAIHRAEEELKSGRYAGANYLCIDRHRGAVVVGGDHVATIELEPGLHLLTNGDLDDPHDARQTYARGLFAMRFAGTVEQFATASRDVLSRHAEGLTAPSIVLRGPDRGTVSSSIMAVAREPAQSVYLFAPGSPDQTAYEDFSPLLSELLAVASKAKPKRSPKAKRPAKAKRPPTKKRRAS
jgi:hypothetical protein